MTFNELVEECWGKLPPIRKHLAGRDAVRRMVADSLTEWDSAGIAACMDPVDVRDYEDRLLQRIQTRRSANEEYGFVLLSIVLTAVLVAVIQWLVQRWLDNHFSIEDIARWQQEAVE